MERDESKRALRLALSHRQKARVLQEQCERAGAEGSMPLSRQSALRRLYTEQLALAESTIARLREAQRQQIADLSRGIRKAQIEEARLSKQASSGEIAPAKANEIHRRLVREADALEARIAECRAVIAADAPEELGGFIDLPMEGYLKPGTARPARPAGRAKVLATLFSIAIALTVFVPWVSYESRPYSLYRLGAVLTQEGIGPDLAPPVVGRVWVLYMLLPLVAVPFAVRRGRRGTGWGLVLVGALIVAGGLAPPLIVGAADASAPESLGGMLGAFRIGALAYCAGGLAFIIAGARRFSPRFTSLRASTQGALAFGAAVAAILVLSVLILAVAPGRIALQFDAELDASGETVRIRCTNRGHKEVGLCVPWPEEGQAPGQWPGGRRSVYGLEVHVRERGKDAFQLFPSTEGLWAAQGVPIRGSGRVAILGGATREIVFDLQGVAAAGADAEAIRLVLVRGDGRAVDSFETPVEQAAAPAAPTPAPTGLPRPSAPAAPSSGAAVAAPGAPQPVPRQSAPEPPPAPEEPRRPALTVRFAGSVGDKVAFTIAYSATGERERVFLKPGDAIAAGWRLDSVDALTGAATLRHPGSGRTVRLLRGATESLPLSDE
ncbi:MAG: hypothetical protein JXR94_13740 [Candidatus Hydrogenedentes bacterium]|nr:hypothetical protein [Candidatus Hydrogenedentota bacterium]